MPRFLRPTNRERKLAAAADQHVPIEDWKLFDIKDISSPARLQKLKELFSTILESDYTMEIGLVFPRETISNPFGGTTSIMSTHLWNK